MALMRGNRSCVVGSYVLALRVFFVGIRYKSTDLCAEVQCRMYVAEPGMGSYNNMSALCAKQGCWGMGWEARGHHRVGCGCVSRSSPRTV